jgi:hypothetical protein
MPGAPAEIDQTGHPALLVAIQPLVNRLERDVIDLA